MAPAFAEPSPLWPEAEAVRESLAAGDRTRFDSLLRTFIAGFVFALPPQYARGEGSVQIDLMRAIAVATAMTLLRDPGRP